MNVKSKNQASVFARNPLKAAAAGLFLGLGCATEASATVAYTSHDRLVRNAADQETVHFALSLPYPDQAGLDAFNEDLYNPSSPNFHKFLSSSEFDAAFAPGQAQYENLKSMARQLGFSIERERDSRTLLDVSASAATIRNVFGAQMVHRRNDAGRDYVTAASEPQEPFMLTAVGAHVIGLDAAPVRPRLSKDHMRQVSGAEVDRAATRATGSQTDGSFAPADLKNAYNLNGIQNGGMPVAVVEFSGAPYHDADVYAEKFGLHHATLVQKDVGSHTTNTSEAVEVVLDIEMVEAIENPKTIYVYTGGPFGSTTVPAVYQQVADDNFVVALSSSWEQCEKYVGLTQAKAEDTAFQKMVSEGMAAFVLAGDSGAQGCLRNGGGSSVVDTGDPDSPNVTVVGGTDLTTNTTTQDWVAETVWNDSKSWAGGGGISSFWSIPAYQKTVNFNGPAGQFSTTMRNDPDVALTASQNSQVYIYASTFGGWCTAYGTSDAAPQYAAFWGLVSKGLGKAAGFANPTLYALAGNASKYADDFHDITNGNNNYYNAYVGFDDASGWGSYDGGNLYKDVLAYVRGSSIAK
jgi:kumamolisin